jgi:dTDP-4-amino-4,6-dideoxygalactose transaminase
MKITVHSTVHTQLELLGAALFGTADAVTTLSGTTAMLTLACCLGRPGTRALVPGWICSGVFHALLLAGLRPVPVDIDASFALSRASAEAGYTSDTSLLIYAPFGGYAPDVAAWLAWAARRDLPVIADLVQAPDPAVWRSVTAHVPAAITSFRPGKPLGAAGGGLIAGSQQVVEAARTFLNAGRDACGLKVALGIELPLTAEAAASALHRLGRLPGQLAAWRSLTGQALRAAAATCLPGWAGYPYGLSRIPLRQGPGQRLNPDRSYRGAGWRRALSERFGVNEQAALPTLDELYDQVMIRSIHPAGEERENDARLRAP